MSEPRYEAPVAPAQAGVASSPKSLLDQMQELLASVTADLADLGSDLEASGARAVDRLGAGDPAGGPITW
ncbi:hypothetical protein C7C46_20095 [Streptomyces tateyamensis]|uniref:Uncharacterized protein n=1 Tax=Streptomyces tateyamensis TaxID=565073 RepID=A0A2V4N004_9ACTN|nr:hypothetical protein C7C46_20095 [Streptomyces tateyamensis]